MNRTKHFHDLRALLAGHGIPISKFAIAIGCSQASAYRKINGVSPFTAIEICKGARFLGIKSDEIPKYFIPKP